MLYSYKPMRRSVWSAAGMAETPVIKDGTIYYLSGYPWNNQVNLHAVDQKSGKEKWTSADELAEFTLDGEHIYASGRTSLFRREPSRTTKNFLRCYSTRTGERIWDLPSIVDSRGVKIVGVGKYIYCLANRLLMAVDKDKGTIVWTLQEEEILPSVVSNIVCQGDTIYAEFEDRSVGFIDGTIGKIKNRVPLGEIDPKVPRTFIVAGDNLLVAGGDGDSSLFNLSSEQLRSIKTGWMTSNLTLADGVAFFGASAPLSVEKRQPETDEVFLCAINFETGASLWKTKMSNYVKSGPVVGNGVVYVGLNSGDLCAVEASSGKLLWKTKCEPMLSSIAFGNGLIFVNCNDKLNVLDAATGEISWTFKFPEYAAAGNPVFENGVVYVVGQDSNLYALNAAPEPKKKQR